MSLWKRKRRIAVLILVFSLFMGGLGPVAQGETVTNAPGAQSGAADSPWLTMEASLGYDGVITYLRKLPLRVTIQNSGADFFGTLAMNVQRFEKEYDRYELPVSVASGATVEMEMPIELTYRQAGYQVELLSDGEVVKSLQVTPARVLDPATLLIGTLGGQTLTHFHITAGRDPLSRGELWQTVPLTAETFPRDQKSLETFAFLAIDGFDVQTLEAAQQQALEGWLQAGGIVMVGGGAQASAGYPYFAKWTGISAGAPYQAQDETPALLSYLKSAEAPFGQEMMLVNMNGASHVAVRGSTPLLDITPVGAGYVMTAAFSLSDKPLITWQGNMVVWQRIMLAAVNAPYQQIVDRQVNYYRRENNYTHSEVLGRIEIPNDNSFVTPITLVMVFLALVGFGSYWLLKKRDKREWMWLSIPVLSIGFSLLFLLISRWTSLRQPILVVSDYIRQDDTGVVTETASISAAIEESIPMTLSVTGGEIFVSDNANYYYESQTNAGEPNKLRYTYIMGERPAMTLSAGKAWNIQTLSVKGENPPQLKVDGGCWFEEDGLHIHLENNGEYALGKGKVITSYGYISVEELLPGQSADYLIRTAVENADTKAGKTNGNGNIPIDDGVMFTKIQQKNLDTYSIISALVYPEIWMDSEKTVHLTEKIYQERSGINGLYDMILYRMNEQAGDMFRYVVFDDSLCEMSFFLNGQEVTRTGQSNVLDIQLKYDLVGKSGYVKSGRGTIPVYVAERQESGGYSRGMQIKERYMSFRLSDKPVFCFAVPEEIREIALEDLNVSAYYLYGVYQLAVYNQEAKAWDSLDVKKPLKDQVNFKVHLSEEGEIYIQFSPGNTTDIYADTSTPYLTMEGRIR